MMCRPRSVANAWKYQGSWRRRKRGRCWRTFVSRWEWRGFRWPNWGNGFWTVANSARGCWWCYTIKLAGNTMAARWFIGFIGNGFLLAWGRDALRSKIRSRTCCWIAWTRRRVPNSCWRGGLENFWRWSLISISKFWIEARTWRTILGWGW